MNPYLTPCVTARVRNAAEFVGNPCFEAPQIASNTPLLPLRIAVRRLTMRRLNRAATGSCIPTESLAGPRHS